MGYWSTRSRFALVTLVVGLMIAIVILPKLHVSRVRAQSTSPDLLLLLAERLLGASPPLSGPAFLQAQTVQLFPGALPTDLPLSLPMPASSTLIGSAERPSTSGITSLGAPGFQSTAQPQGGERTDVVLDAPESPADVIAFYTAAMGNMGWTVPPQFGPIGVVATPFGGANSATFCQSTTGPLLSVNASTPDGGPTDVRVHVDTGSSGQCNPPTPGGPGAAFIPPGAGLFALLPTLRAPDGVTVRTTLGSSGGGGRFGSDALATTDMTASDLASAYASELQAAGWLQSDSRGSGPFAWSTWSIPDHDDCQGFLYVRQGPPDGELTLHVEVASTDSTAYTSNGGFYGGAGSVSTISSATAPLRPTAGTGTQRPGTTPTATGTPAAGH